MITYSRIAVGATFSPTFPAVLAEARAFADRCSASLEIIHAGPYDAGMARQFLEALGRPAEIRWVQADSPAQALASAAMEFGYDLLVGGALQREDADKPFTSGVARELLRLLPCDLLLVPGPRQEPPPIEHVVFLAEPGEECERFLTQVVETVNARRVTIAAAESPFAAALAASRGEEPHNVHAWSEGLADGLRQRGMEAEAWVVSSNTGYTLCDTVIGFNADLLVVKTNGHDWTLPVHLDWLYQVIPLRLLVVRGS